jgi:hypothetical protein
MAKLTKVDYKKFIEENFMILDREGQIPVPFRFNVVQQKYYDMMFVDEKAAYPNQEGVREIILKARQQGFSSFILALFAVDFLTRPYSISICISHRKDSTELLFKKVRFYIESYLRKLAKMQGIKFDDEVMRQFFKSDNKGMIENATNHAMFYIGTAGSKVGGRGGSARNIHFSEAAFYQDTELITAKEIIVATAQQVPQGRGMIFIESTANGEGNFYHSEWVRAESHESSYKPRFFGWQEFYSATWVEEKRREFPSDKLWKQEYPATAEEAFITSGSPYFDAEKLNDMLKIAPTPVDFGRVAPDGNFF